jgi:hypothetical protein
MKLSPREDFLASIVQVSQEAEQFAREVDKDARETLALQGSAAVWESINPFPVVLDTEEATEARNIAELISSNMMAFADGLDTADLRDRCCWLGLEAEVTDAIIETERLSTDWWSRIDLMADEAGWRVVEVNVGGGMGGCHVSDLSSLQARHESIAGHVADVGLVFSDPASAYVDRVAVLWKARGGHGAVALVDWDGFLPECEHFLGRFVDRLEASGVPAVACEVGDLTVTPNELLLPDGRASGLLVANYLLEDVIESGPTALREMCTLSDLTLVMGLQGEALATKSCATEVRDRLASTAPEVLARSIPASVWGPRLVAGQEEFMADKDDYVVKPQIGSSGSGVVIGRSATDVQWADGLRAAVESPGMFVVQERIGDAEWVHPMSDGVSGWSLKPVRIQLSVFTLNGAAVGEGARLQQLDDPRVMSTFKGAQLATVLTPTAR